MPLSLCLLIVEKELSCDQLTCNFQTSFRKNYYNSDGSCSHQSAFFVLLVLNQKMKMKIRNIMVPSYHSKVGSTQKWETHFSVLVMEFVLYLHVWVKSKVFSITLSRQSLSTFNVCMKMENELYVFLTRFTLFCCFMKMFHSLQI